jgi:hypothetical protein
MRAHYDFFKAIASLFGGGQQPSQPVYFNSGPSQADLKAQADAAAEEAKRKSMADRSNRSGAANTLLTAADGAGDFSKLGTKKSLLGGV